MAIQKTRKQFFETVEGLEIKQALEQMVADSKFNTLPSYSANAALYPDNLMPFVDRHMNYIMCHPRLEAKKYLANVKLVTRLR